MSQMRDEWIAALSSDFHADRRFAAWHAEWNDDLEGSIGIWQHVIEVADACHKAIGAKYYDVHFYDMVDRVVEMMYAVPPHHWSSQAPTSLREIVE